MVKKIVKVALLSFVIVSFFCQGIGYFAEENIILTARAESVDMQNTLLYKSGTMKKGKLDGSNYRVGVYVDSEHPKTIELSSSSSAAIAYFFGKNAAECDATLMSYDVYYATGGLRTYTQSYTAEFSNVSSLTANDFFCTIQTIQGAVRYFADLVNRGNSIYYMPEETGKWYHVDIWSDYRNKEMIYYVDGSLFGKVVLPDELNSVGGFRYVVEKNGSFYGKHYLDNVQMYDFYRRGSQVDIDNVTVPDDFEKSVGIRFNKSKNELGFIHFNKNVNIKIDLDNVSEQEIQGSLDINVMSKDINDENTLETVWTKSDKVTLAADSVTEKTFNFTVPSYGFYNISITLSDGQGNLINEKTQDFSVANGAKVQNDKMYLADYTDPANSSGYGYAEYERKYNLFKKAGFGGVRAEYTWKAIEPTEGDYVIPATTRNIFSAATNNNLKIIPLVMGSPSFVSGNPPRSDEDLEKWKGYVKYLAANLPDTTEYLEIWNEYNVLAFNADGGTPADYAKLLKASKEALDEIGSDLKVAGFAVANVGKAEENETKTCALEWMEEVLAAGGGDYMDVASIHGYTHTTPESDLSSGNGRRWLVSETRDLLDNYGYTDMPIIMTEMGWNNAATEALQGAYFIRYATIFGEGMDCYAWYSSQATEKTGDSAAENDFGIIRACDEAAADVPYEAKPAFLALSNYNALLAKATLQGKQTTSSSNLYNYKFTDRSGLDLYMIWAKNNKTGNVTVTKGNMRAIVYDMYGNITQTVDDGTTLTVNATQMPIYVRLVHPLNVSVDYNTNEITLNGFVERGGGKAGITFIKEGADTIDDNSLLYVGEADIDQGGAYSVRFKAKNVSGTYRAKVGYSYDDYTTDETSVLIDLFGMNVTKNGEKAEWLSDLSPGDTINISLYGIGDFTTDGQTALYVAQYNGSVLTSVSQINVGENVSAFDSDYVLGDLSKLTKIKIMYWNKGKLMPIMGLYEIK